MAKQLVLNFDLASYLNELEDNDRDLAIKEYADWMAGEGTRFTQRGSEFTFTGTEDELVNVLYLDQLHWGEGFSFSEEDAREDIRALNK